MNTATKTPADTTMGDYLKAWADLQPDRCTLDEYGIHVFMGGCWHSLGLEDTCYSRALVVAAVEEVLVERSLHWCVQFNARTGLYLAAAGVGVGDVVMARTQKSPVKAEALLSALLQCLQAQEQPC